MENASDAVFAASFQEFLGKLPQHDGQKRLEALHMMQKAHNDIVNHFPVDSQNEVTGPAVTSPISRRQQAELIDVECFIADKIYQGGHGRSLFTRYDQSNSGEVSPQQFQAVVMSLGSTLSPQELELISLKYDLHNTGNIRYDDFLRYVSAKRGSHARSSAHHSYSHGVLQQRPVLRGKDLDELIQSLAVPAHVRGRKGMEKMREALYAKEGNFHNLHSRLRGTNLLISIDELVPQLTSLGFPEGLCSPDEMKQLCMQFSRQHPGYLDYREMVALFSGVEYPVPEVDHKTRISRFAQDNELISVLIKLNNQNLRKVFQHYDNDSDGLITSAELSLILNNNGLSTATTCDADFKEYVNTFCQRKAGHMHYAEFMRFISQRSHSTIYINGEAQGSQQFIETPGDATPQDLIISLHKETRGRSLLTVFEQYDRQFDACIRRQDFGKALEDLGFHVPHAVAMATFDEFNPNQDNAINYHAFCRTITNPNTNSKFALSHRVNPGGDSSVPIGEGLDDIVEVPQKQQFAFNVPPGGESHWDFKQEPVPFTPSKNIRPNVNDSTVDLTMDPSYVPPPYVRKMCGPQEPPSVVNFAEDHGAVLRDPRLQVRQTPGGNSQVSLQFDPTSPLDPVKQGTRPSYSQSNSSISFAPLSPDEIDSQNRQKSLGATPGGNSQISFNSNDTEEYKPFIKAMAPPGGECTADLTFQQHPDTQNDPNRSVSTPPHQIKNADLFGFDPKHEIDALHIGRRHIDPPPSQVSFAHGHDVAPPTSPQTHKGKGHIRPPGDSPSSLMLGQNDDTDAFVAAIEERHAKLVAASQNGSSSSPSSGSLDWDLLARIRDAVYSKGRTRRTFQDFNRLAGRKASSVLSIEDLKDGLASFNVHTTIPELKPLYDKFDVDDDGALTFSEFVRMLATNGPDHASSTVSSPPSSQVDDGTTVVNLP